MVSDMWVPYKCQFLPSPLLFKVPGGRLHLNAMPRRAGWMLWIGYVPLRVRSPRYGCVRGGRTLRGHMSCKVLRSSDVLSFEGFTAWGCFFREWVLTKWGRPMYLAPFYIWSFPFLLFGYVLIPPGTLLGGWRNEATQFPEFVSFVKHPASSILFGTK